MAGPFNRRSAQEPPRRLGGFFSVHRILPRNAARIFRKKYAVSRYP